MKNYHIDRFTEMYDVYYEQVAGELRSGRKKSHWMWFIFPQIKGLGHSPMARYYALQDIDEAKVFLKSSCGKKMQTLLQILLNLQTDNAEAVLGVIDAVKLKSSMTLFNEADSADPIFSRILNKFYNGQKDDKTIRILETAQGEIQHISPRDFLQKLAQAENQWDEIDMHELRLLIFEETLQISQNRTYTADDGNTVTLPNSFEMMEHSKLYRSVERTTAAQLPEKTIVEVLNSDSLLAGKKLIDEGFHPAVLNFANRQRAGGGVLRGANAQEENIFRRSDLALSLYQFHPIGMEFGIPQRKEQYPMDRTTGGAYSPDITVFRGPEQEGYPLLALPYRLGIVTVAAMNRPELKSPQEIADHLVEPTLEKIRTIFRIALNNGHDSLVLGAWGCGAFRNPPEHIAKLFHTVMDETEFCDKFKKILFAIMARKNGNLLPFLKEFSPAECQLS